MTAARAEVETELVTRLKNAPRKAEPEAELAQTDSASVAFVYQNQQ